jgi:CRP/FNR family cyclic AMP-dependent transcriptional regulator
VIDSATLNGMLKIENKFKFAQESIRDLSHGDLIFHEGDDSREMYVVVEGEVTVSKKSAKGQITLATLKKGDFVGEMSLLESLPRSATARATGKTKLLVIHPGGFLLKIRRDPTFAFEMLQTLSRRIRVTNDALMNELNSHGSSHDSLRAIIQGAEFSKNEGIMDTPSVELPNAVGSIK